jgi:beta-lactamase regulating signal transducer with metallopeptidase domain
MITPVIAAVLDHLWQSTFFAIAIGALTLLLRKNGAHVRYWLWLVASLKFLIPFSWLAAAADLLTPASMAPVPSFDPIVASAQPLAQPFATSAPVQAASVYVDANTPLLLFGIWALGMVAVVMFRFARWKQVEEALWSAKPVSMSADVPVKTTAYFMEPGLVGIRRPALLLPEDIISRLSTDELNAIVAHEHAHLRRRDNFTATLHMLVEALFWFYPPVWWIGLRLIEERERACDESVLASGRSAEVYAESILKVCRLYVQSPLASVSGVSGADLKKRIEAIMSDHLARRLGPVKAIALSIAVVIVVITPLAAGVVTPLDISAASTSPAEVALRRAEQQRPRTAIALDPAVLDNYVGFYHLRANVILTVRRVGSRMIAQVPGTSSIDLLPESETKFFATAVPAQVTFITDLQGRATEIILHQNGLEKHAKRIESDVAPGTDTEASLRRYLASLQRGAPNYEEMAPELAAAVRQNLPNINAQMKQWGALRDVRFTSMNSLGADMYLVTFEHAQVEWIVAPLLQDGKVGYRTFREIKAEAKVGP